MLCVLCFSRGTISTSSMQNSAIRSQILQAQDHAQRAGISSPNPSWCRIWKRACTDLHSLGCWCWPAEQIYIPKVNKLSIPTEQPQVNGNPPSPPASTTHLLHGRTKLCRRGRHPLSFSSQSRSTLRLLNSVRRLPERLASSFVHFAPPMRS